MVQQSLERPDIFVGRQHEQAHYQKFLRGEDRQWLLLLTGIPGIGKTTLLHQLKAHTPNDVGIAHLNFEHIDPYPHLLTDPLQVLEALAISTEHACDQKKYNEFMSTLQKGREQLKQSKEQISNQPDLQELAHVKQNLLSKVQKSVRGEVTRAFYDQIETFKKMRLVLLFDTCELLNEPEGWEVGKWLIGELLPELHECLGQVKRTCFVVLASRVPLEFDVLQEQKRLQLKLLPKKEVLDYLELAGLETRGDNSEEWKERVYKITHGHPLSLSIMRELWRVEDTNPSSGEDAALDAFQSRFEDTVSIEFVEQRILDRLKPPFRALTEYAVVLRSFDLPQLQQLFPELLPESEASEVFNRFIRYPYIESIRGYHYIFHEFIRGVLARYTQAKYPERWKHYHRVALAYFTDSGGAPRSPEWYYHLIAANETEGMQAWQEAIEQARIAGNGQAVGALLQIARDKALNLTLASQDIVIEEEARFYQESGLPKKSGTES